MFIGAACCETRKTFPFSHTVPERGQSVPDQSEYWSTAARVTTGLGGSLDSPVTKVRPQTI